MAHLDLTPLRSVKLASGFCGVYPKRSRWVAKPFRARYAGTYLTPTEAAVAVAAWWHDRHGEHWPDAFRARHRSARKIVRDRQCGGYRLVAHVRGRPRVVPPPDTSAITFPNYSAARQHFEAWSRERYGVLAPVVLCGSHEDIR